MGLEFDLELPRRDFLMKAEGRFDKKTVGIFGPSGAGKTSLFRMICGLTSPASGRIILNGRTLADTESGIMIPPQKRRIGVVFQEKLIFPHLTIRENLLFGARYAKRGAVSFDEAVGLLKLESLLSSMPAEASGGELQRAAIGRALLSGPELLLLDEPFNAVDATLRRTILPYLRKIRDELNIPMLVISHDLPDLQALTDTLYLLDRGRCRGYGSVHDLLSESREFAKESDLVNTIEVTDPVKSPDGLYSCALTVTDSENETEPVPRVTAPAAGESGRFFLTIRPDEISLSKGYISGISIQNQIPATVTEIVKINGSVFCFVDAGVPLIVKVTADAVRDMGLSPGLKVFCLFKAHSLHL